MNSWTLLQRGLRYYWRTHLGVVLGSAVGTAVLVGALAVGDSVRHSLRSLADARLGRARLALASPDRYFRQALADELAGDLDAPAAPVLLLRGVAAAGGARANGVQVLGVDERFWRLSPAGAAPAAEMHDGVVINRRLARQLGAGAGAMILLRVDRPSLLPRDAPISVVQAQRSLAGRLTVRAVASDEQFGRFDLQANQVGPYTAFVPLEWLQKRTGLAGRANLLLVAAAAPEAANAALRARWRLGDADLAVRELAAPGVVELRSGRVFIDPPAAKAAAAVGEAPVGVLTYLVNEIRRGGRSTPYAIVSAISPLGEAAAPAGPGQAPSPGAGLVPPDMPDDHIVINQWLADDLQAGPGDEVELSFSVLGPTGRLEKRTRRLKVRAVVPTGGLGGDRSLMPDLPGLPEVQSCRAWRLHVADLAVREKDWQYWRRHGGTPKGFVTLRAGRDMWASRFGDLTAVRWPASAAAAAVEEALRRRLDPAEMGLFFRDVRAPAASASRQGIDFGWLFLSLSFFLVAAAVLLMGLLFVFGVEQRTEEVGTLLALGWPLGKVRRLLLAEGVILAAAGAALGLPAALAYTRAVLAALATLWRGAVAGAAIDFHAAPGTLAAGSAAAVGIATAVMWLLIRRLGRVAPRELLAGGDAGSKGSAGLLARPRGPIWIALASAAAGAVVLSVWAGGRDAATAAAFFISGAMFLVAMVAAACGVLAWPRGRSGGPLTARGLSARNAARRPGRSLAVIALLAVGSFLVVAVGANRLDPLARAAERGSGTGGFALLASSALPVLSDLNTPAGQRELGVDPEKMRGVRVVPMRVRQGDDASCLNLNRAQTPTLLGVRAEELSGREAFRFVEAAPGYALEKGWALLGERGRGEVAAVGDAATVTWALGKSVGDTLDYVDERGRAFTIRIVAAIDDSILQGSLLVAEDAFLERFPSSSGHRMFLIDAPPASAEAVAAALTEAGEDAGVEVVPAVRRLAEFTAVQNTYLSIFQALGGLGLALGAVGLGVVVMRNVLERRGELALLQAVGFTRGAIQRLVLAEHQALLLAGLAAGVAAATWAVLPALRSPGAEIPYASLALTLAAIVLSGLVWTFLATGAALRGPLLPALRSE